MLGTAVRMSCTIIPSVLARAGTGEVNIYVLHAKSVGHSLKFREGRSLRFREGVLPLCCYCYMCTSMELDGIHPRVLRELVEMLTEPLSIIYQQLWLSRKVPVDRRKKKAMPSYKGWKDVLGNYRLVSLILVLGRLLEQIISSAITWQDSWGIRPRQHGSVKSRSCLTGLTRSPVTR